MTESEKKQIVDLWESGMSLPQVKKMIAVDDATFNAAIKEMRANGELSSKRKGTDEKIIEAYTSGVQNPYKLAEMYGVSYGYVNLVFHLHKVKRPKRNWKYCDRTNAIVADLSEGALNHSQIAKKHGVNRQWVYQICKKMEKGILDYEQPN
jgi:transposase